MKWPPEQRDRGLAVGLMAFVAILVIAALMYTLLDPAATQMFELSGSAAKSATANDAIDRRKQIWDLLLFYPLLFAGLMLLARSLFESRRPR